eukprot:snap_masked-scaffold_13-processed-gene-8.56-mRNA-1 protein AED:0.03 eAED:0.04 QI:0/0/0/1/1/1/2/0/275
MRVVSLLPSATEIIARIIQRQPNQLKGKVQFVGRSHECDYPKAFVKSVPVLTSQSTVFTTSKGVDDQVRTSLESGTSLYNLDIEKLSSLKPDVIVTQSLCSVCSIDYSLVEAVARTMHREPKVVSLNPFSLKDVLNDIRIVGEALSLLNEAEQEIQKLENRIQRIKVLKSKLDSSKLLLPKQVGFLEWTDPLYVGGHWTPEIIQFAGHNSALNPETGVASFCVSPDSPLFTDLDVVVSPLKLFLYLAHVMHYACLCKGNMATRNQGIQGAYTYGC